MIIIRSSKKLKQLEKTFGIKLNKKLKKSDIEYFIKCIGSPKGVADVLEVTESEVTSYVSNKELDKIHARYPYNKEYLSNMYNELGSVAEVAAKLSVTYATALHWFKVFNIKVDHTKVYSSLKKASMAEDQKALLIGCMLGRCFFRKAPHSKDVRLQIGVLEEHEGLLILLKKLLNPFVRSIKVKHVYADGELLRLKVLTTIPHKDITHLYSKYYDNHEVVLKNISEQDINAITIAVWLCFSAEVYKDKTGKPYKCVIRTDFSYKECLYLVKLLRNFFKGKIAVRGSFIYLYGVNFLTRFLNVLSIVLNGNDTYIYQNNPQRLGVKPL
jgi:hypothetical protein